MKKRIGLPAVGRTTMLGLNLAKTLEYTTWLRILPNTTSATPKKQSYVLATSTPSPTCPEPPQINFWESLDTCLQRNGSMEPFHSLFDQTHLDADVAEPKDDGITSSIKPLDISCLPDTTTSQFDAFDLNTATKPSSFPILHPFLTGKEEMFAFRALFPAHLLLMQVDEIPHTNTNTVSVLEAKSLFHLDLLPPSHGSEVPVHMLGNKTTSTETYDLGLLTAGTPSFGYGGRNSPQPSITAREYSSSLSDGMNSSRRSSWATSISTHLGDDDHGHPGLDCAKLTGEPDHDIYEDELIHAYQHYCELIDVGDPQNCRDKDFSAQKPDQEEDNGVVTAGTATHGAGGLAVEASGDMVSDNPCEPMTHAESVPKEDSMQPGSRSTLNNEIKITPLSTPAEAAAWAHSYCDADPESTKIKILTDDGGKEYVLYHDCFHCVPIDLAPELIQITEEDDGYGSAPETCEAAKDGTKLGTIPEDENEG